MDITRNYGVRNAEFEGGKRMRRSGDKAMKSNSPCSARGKLRHLIKDEIATPLGLAMTRHLKPLYSFEPIRMKFFALSFEL